MVSSHASIKGSTHVDALGLHVLGHVDKRLAVGQGGCAVLHAVNIISVNKLLDLNLLASNLHQGGLADIAMDENMLVDLHAQVVAQQTPNLLGKDVSNRRQHSRHVSRHLTQALRAKKEKDGEHGPGSVEAVGHEAHNGAAVALWYGMVALHVHLGSMEIGVGTIQQAKCKEDPLEVANSHGSGDTPDDAANIRHQQPHGALVVIVLKTGNVGQMDQNDRTGQEPLAIAEP
mmetsp:Transcript_8002/g.24131  ORF Transcript_8002/g.24131 Transcript_8002/m.24131 type:complete len:231 (+) Transcript_8002:1223-1915(+)